MTLSVSTPEGEYDHGTLLATAAAVSRKPSPAVSGILVSRSVRSSFASFTLAPFPPMDDDDDDNARDGGDRPGWLDSTTTTTTSPVLVRLQFMDDVKELRSFCRKRFKIGDAIDFLGSSTLRGRWERSPASSATTGFRTETTTTMAPNAAAEDTTATATPTATITSLSQQPRWVVDLDSVSDAEASVVVRRSRAWAMKECQNYQLRYLPSRKQQPKRKQGPTTSDKQPQRFRPRDHTIENDDGGAGSRTDQSTKNEDDNRGVVVVEGNHGGGKEKRSQAEALVSFFVRLIGTHVVAVPSPSPPPEDRDMASPSLAEAIAERTKHDEAVRAWFNRADGVLDVAGGCGHVSMALGLEGIASTVVDARASAGKLPKRDRKVWKRSLRTGFRPMPSDRRPRPPPTNNALLVTGHDECCLPVVPAPRVIPFRSQQAWFGSKPAGYDASFRHPGDDSIPVLVATGVPKTTTATTTITTHELNHGGGSTCGDSTSGGGVPEGCVRASSRVDNDNEGESSSSSSSRPATASTDVLRKTVSALVALHPDEATGEVVMRAVEHRIPFVVVPCCVFARLFPNRRTPDDRPVSSYEDLLDFLQSMDPSIKRTRLPFGGKNIALWSVFPDG